MTEETRHSKDGDYIKHESIRLPVKTYRMVLDFRIKDEEAAKEAWLRSVKASGCSVITGPVVRETHDVLYDELFTVIEGLVVDRPDIPGEGSSERA